jgi:hypothetical protein
MAGNPIKSIILATALLAAVSLHAQQRMMAPRRPLLKDLQLSRQQRLQIQELIRQQRAQQMQYDLRLQQILTPAQKARLQQYNRQKALQDSLDRQKRQP